MHMMQLWGYNLERERAKRLRKEREREIGEREREREGGRKGERRERKRERERERERGREARERPPKQLTLSSCKNITRAKSNITGTVKTKCPTDLKGTHRTGSGERHT